MKRFPAAFAARIGHCAGRGAGLFLALIMTASLTPAVAASAPPLTLERVFGDPALSGPTPRGVHVSPDGQRVGFLRGRAEDQFQLDLWIYESGQAAPRRLVDSKQLVPEETLSEAEKARRERQRTTDLKGIADYAWAPDGQRLLFPLGDALYLFDLHGAAHPRKLYEAPGIVDAQVSPAGHYVSFVREQNLYVIDLATGQLRPLTQDGGGTVFNGESEFVAQEEMDAPHGYWWAPDDSAIAFKQFDEAPVPLRRRFEIYADRTEIVEQRYPAAGDPNVRLRLGVVTPRGGAPRWVDLGADADLYLPRVDWIDAAQLSYQRQSRDQKTLELIAVRLSDLSQRPLLTETSATWINLHHDLRFLPDGGFVWGSERSGYKHLYRYAANGSVQALTAGDWQVDALEAIDLKAGRLYFTANKDDVRGRQLYAVPLAGGDPQTPQRISHEEGQHDVDFPSGSQGVALYVDRYSNAVTPPSTAIHAADGWRLAWIEENRVDAQHPLWPYRSLLSVPDYGSLSAEDGQRLEYRVIKPADFDPARRYPVLLTVYGGPHVQNVADAWDARSGMFLRYMAQRGYVVFTLDNRGSARRGRAFEDAIYHHMGEAEVRDQRAGLDWLRAQPWVDAQRIGVFGWSYGGYMTLMMLAKDSSRVAAGAAVAPVTDWRLYDTHYTERYLGTPRENPEGYAQSAVFSALDGLSSSLLLVHGMADDNVLFLHSTQLMAALQARGKRFELMTYPGEKHRISTPPMRLHVYHEIVDFLDRKLSP
jgi:dipeptidyl-peptidase-4